MKLYENYLFDESEKSLADTHKDLAVNGVYKPEINKDSPNAYSDQCKIVESAYVAVCNLMQIENVEMCTGGGCFHFDTIHSVINNIQSCSVSPELSREKLLSLKIHEVANVICSLFLDRDNWSKEILTSHCISDGNGNWLI